MNSAVADLALVRSAHNFYYNELSHEPMKQANNATEHLLKCLSKYLPKHLPKHFYLNVGL